TDPPEVEGLRGHEVDPLEDELEAPRKGLDAAHVLSGIVLSVVDDVMGEAGSHFSRVLPGIAVAVRQMTAPQAAETSSLSETAEQGLSSGGLAVAMGRSRIGERRRWNVGGLRLRPELRGPRLEPARLFTPGTRAAVRSVNRTDGRATR